MKTERCTFCGATTDRRQLSICDQCIRIAHGWRPPKPALDLRPGATIRVKVGLKSEAALVIQPYWECDLRFDGSAAAPLSSGPMAIAEFKNGSRVAVSHRNIVSSVRDRTQSLVDKPPPVDLLTNLPTR